MSEENKVIPIGGSFEVSTDILGYESEKLDEIETFFGIHDLGFSSDTKFQQINDGSDVKAIMAQFLHSEGLATYKVGIFREDVQTVDAGSGEPVKLNRFAQFFCLDVQKKRISSCVAEDKDLGAAVVSLSSFRPGDSQLTNLQFELENGLRNLGLPDETEISNALSAANFEVMLYMIDGYTFDR